MTSQSTRLRLSRYNVEVGGLSESGCPTGLFNTATGNYVALIGDVEVAWRRLRGGEGVSPAEAGLLFRAGFAVEEQLDELRAVRLAFEVGRRVDQGSHLTIAPTLDCNYACDYCFEEHVPGAMSSEVQQALIGFVRERLVRQQPTDLSVTWFGGEPLMAPSVIRVLSRAFQALVTEGLLLSYQAHTITNGQLLRPEMAAELLALGVNQVQVTLDGPREVHDRRRTLKNGGATFAAIANNLARMPSGLATVIRINVDRSNVSTVPRLFDELETLDLLGRVTVDVALVEDFSGCEMPSETLLAPKEFAGLEMEWMREAERRGFRLHVASPSPRLTGVCQVDSLNSFVVAPTGELYRCWAELGNGGHAVAQLLNRLTWSAPEPTGLTERDPFDDEECLACVLLPSCMGGCPLLRQNHRYWGQKVCPSIKHNFSEVLAGRFGQESRVVRYVRDSNDESAVIFPFAAVGPQPSQTTVGVPFAIQVPSSVRNSKPGVRSASLRVVQ
jgi:uncharacterized protein